MDGAQRHDDELIRLFAQLHARRAKLITELAEVDRDMDAVWRTASIELRSRQAAATAGGSIHPRPATYNDAVKLPLDSGGTPSRRTLVLEAPAATETAEDHPVLVSQGTPHPGRSIPPDPGTLAALAALGPVRDDNDLSLVTSARRNDLSPATRLQARVSVGGEP